MLQRIDNVPIVVEDLGDRAGHPPHMLGVDDVVTRLRSHGGELVGEFARYEDLHRL